MMEYQHRALFQQPSPLAVNVAPCHLIQIHHVRSWRMLCWLKKQTMQLVKRLEDQHLRVGLDVQNAPQKVRFLFKEIQQRLPLTSQTSTRISLRFWCTWGLPLLFLFWLVLFCEGSFYHFLDAISKKKKKKHFWFFGAIFKLSKPQKLMFQLLMSLLLRITICSCANAISLLHAKLERRLLKMGLSC